MFAAEKHNLDNKDVIMLQKPADRRAAPLTANLFHVAQSLFLSSLPQDLLAIVSQFANSNKLINKSQTFHLAQQRNIPNRFWDAVYFNT